MVEALTRIFTDLASDSSVFHVVIEAEGKFFSTGMDLASLGPQELQTTPINRTILPSSMLYS
jgi:enoyl-CoA hydratase/carnithine racemase